MKDPGEILLGARRPPRRILKRLAIAGLILTGALVIAWVAFRRATSFPVPRGDAPDQAFSVNGNRLVLGPASLERAGEVWVLRLAGDPFALGAEQGRLLGARALTGDGALDAVVQGADPPTGFLGGFRREVALRWRLRLLADGIPGDRRRELAGLAVGLRGRPGAPAYQDLVWRQAALDVGQVEGGELPFGGVAGGLAFSLGKGVAPYGRFVVGRAFGLAGTAPAGDAVVSFVKPDGAIPFARVGWAGQVGAVTGVNAEGLFVAVNPAVADDVRPDGSGEPVALLCRDVLERARTVNEAVDLIKAARPLGAASFLLADRKSGASLIVERSPSRTAVVKPKAAQLALGSGGFLLANEFGKDAENDRARRQLPAGARADRLAELLEHPPAPDVAGAVSLLRDRRGKGDAPLPAGNGNAIDDLAQAHVVIVDLGAMVLWVGEGPGAAGGFRAFDLLHELVGAAPRPALAPLAADPTVEPAQARAILLARQELRDARRLSRRGERAAAREAAARALALWPELADAHKLAGDLAMAAGDEEAARAHYRRFLALAPADRGAVNEAKAVLGVP